MPASTQVTAGFRKRNFKLLPPIAAALETKCFPFVSAGLRDALGEVYVPPDVSRVKRALFIGLRGASGTKARETTQSPVCVEPELIVTRLMCHERHRVVESYVSV